MRGDKLLNIKVYDKILDLVGREATHLVSTRMAMVIGATNQLGKFERLIR